LIDLEFKIKPNSEDPFYHIAQDSKKMSITRLLASGNMTKEIAQVLNLSEDDIEAIRKKILHDTHCRTMVEYIAKAKDKKII